MAQLATGEEVLMVAFSNNVLTFSSPRAFPPGSPVSITWDGQDLQGRSLGSKRGSEEQFNVRMRMVNLTKVQREQLLAAATHWT